MAIDDDVVGKEFVVFIFLFCVVTISPWAGFFWHGHNYNAGDDGPASIFLMVITVGGSLLLLMIYSLAIYLNSVFRRKPFLTCVVTLLMSVVLISCAASAFFWARLGVNDAFLFLLTAVGYAACTLKVFQHIVFILRG